MAGKRPVKKRQKFAGCPCTGKNLPKLVHPAILAIVSKEPTYGYAITERIAEQLALPTGAPKHSGIYRILRQLEKGGYLKSRLAEPQAGPARRIYSITPKGKDCLQQWLVSLTEYKHAIESLLTLGKVRR